MKKATLFILLSIFCAANIFAQRNDRQMRPEDREKWLIELRNYKHEFLTKELDLTKEQQEAFFPLYDKMDDQVSKIASDTRLLETSIQNNPEASSEDLQEGARALFEQKGKEADVEMSYFDKFKEILTAKQLFRLKNTERKFTNQLVRQHHGSKSDKPVRQQK